MSFIITELVGEGEGAAAVCPQEISPRCRRRRWEDQVPSLLPSRAKCAAILLRLLTPISPPSHNLPASMRRRKEAWSPPAAPPDRPRFPLPTYTTSTFLERFSLSLSLSLSLSPCPETDGIQRRRRSEGLHVRLRRSHYMGSFAVGAAGHAPITLQTKEGAGNMVRDRACREEHVKSGCYLRLARCLGHGNVGEGGGGNGRMWPARKRVEKRRKREGWWVVGGSPLPAFSPPPPPSVSASGWGRRRKREGGFPSSKKKRRQ